MLSDERYQFVVSQIEGMALDALWLYMEDESATYDGRKRAFLSTLERMLNEKMIVAAKGGEALEIPSSEIALLFEKSFPQTEADMDGGVWFFTETCPAGIGWCRADGGIDWV
ncbi:DUF596 domain-containing protein [Paraburkholderia guartelaensis]|uniref:DUF596 domain-containing protein n=1 Tax=Paraburkholderia guartelaensis TaxID=2546446 RepID=UPI002AB6C64D|nr:DUF596 domain-containing protein [Paraburkholderia guartelaensis]